jgi:hypothetical protein
MAPPATESYRRRGRGSGLRGCGRPDVVDVALVRVALADGDFLTRWPSSPSVRPCRESVAGPRANAAARVYHASGAIFGEWDDIVPRDRAI